MALLAEGLCLDGHLRDLHSLTWARLHRHMRTWLLPKQETPHVARNAPWQETPHMAEVRRLATAGTFLLQWLQQVEKVQCCSCQFGTATAVDSLLYLIVEWGHRLELDSLQSAPVWIHLSGTCSHERSCPSALYRGFSERPESENSGYACSLGLDAQHH